MIRVLKTTDLAQFCALDPALEPDVVRRQQPDAHWLARDSAGRLLARCSTWRPGTPAPDGSPAGFIGHFAAHDDEAARLVLTAACAALAGQDCRYAFGPIDGSTWERYRLITERGDEPPFFLEPDHPTCWPAYFRDSGFGDYAGYVSAVTDSLAVDEPRLAELEERLAGQGIALRTFDTADPDADLRRIYQVATASFQQNLLYSPIGEEAFLAQYRPYQHVLQPEWVLLAEAEGRPIGFLFALPDLAQAQRGQPVDTLIVKTLAVRPEHAGLGLGGLLVARCQQLAARAGYRRAIHALMHESNRSLAISARYGRTMRRYTLFARAL